RRVTGAGAATGTGAPAPAAAACRPLFLGAVFIDQQLVVIRRAAPPRGPPGFSADWKEEKRHAPAPSCITTLMLHPTGAPERGSPPPPVACRQPGPGDDGAHARWHAGHRRNPEWQHLYH